MWNDQAQVFQLIDQHIRWRPQMQLQDVYKLLYQGTLGPEHILASPVLFTQRLSLEMSELSASSDERLWEPIRPDQALVRLNLRPFTALAGDVHCLVSACLKTGEQPWGTKNELRDVWKLFAGFCQGNLWPNYSHENLVEFSNRLVAEDYPAVHHTREYRAVYQPAYRLVAKEFLLS